MSYQNKAVETYEGLGSRRFYAGYSYMGTQFTYDSPCWIAYVFGSRRERDEWVAEDAWDDQGNRVIEALARRDAFRIAGIHTNDLPGAVYNGSAGAYELVKV